MFIWDAVGSYQNLDPEYMEQWKRESLLRLEAKDRRQNKQSVDNKLSKRQKKSKETKDKLVQYLVKIDKFDPDTGIVDKRFLDEAIMSVTECIDPRTIAKRQRFLSLTVKSRKQLEIVNTR